MCLFWKLFVSNLVGVVGHDSRLHKRGNLLRTCMLLLLISYGSPSAFVPFATLD